MSMFSAMSVIVKGIEQSERRLRLHAKRVDKAAQNAAKIEGYRLRALLRHEIGEGAPGGAVFSPLTMMARRMRKDHNRKPLARLMLPVQYRAGFESGNFRVKVGYITEEIGMEGIKAKNRISKSWAYIQQFQQEGRTVPVTPEMRRRLRQWGGKLAGPWVKGSGRAGSFTMKRKARNWMMGDYQWARYFFLRKETTQFKIPARPIIAPFQRRHEHETRRNFLENFVRKMAGERI